jgi:hypothetical protein
LFLSHAQSFFVRQGKVAEERYMAFNLRKTQCLTEIMALKAEYESLNQTLV